MLTRREFLHLSALTAACGAVVACAKQTPTTDEPALAQTGAQSRQKPDEGIMVIPEPAQKPQELASLLRTMTVQVGTFSPTNESQPDVAVRSRTAYTGLKATLHDADTGQQQITSRSRITVKPDKKIALPATSPYGNVTDLPGHASSWHAALRPAQGIKRPSSTYTGAAVLEITMAEPERPDVSEQRTLQQQEDRILVYPGAIGFGVSTPAGRGGTVVHVTTTQDGEQPGTLRYALQVLNEPRSVIFDVGGVFQVNSTIHIANPYLSVYGQTAPYPGAIIRGGLRMRTNNVFLQHLTIWGGKLDQQCIDILGSDQGSQRIVIDHCTLMWGWSKMLQTWSGEHVLSPGSQGVDWLTVSNCLIAEPLLGPKEDSHRGLILQEFTYHAALLRNLFVNCERRSPAVHDGTSAVIANNLTYNPGTASIHWLPTNGVGPALASIMGNVIRPGPSTTQEGARIMIDNAYPGSRFYLEDNIAPLPPWIATPSTLCSERPIWPTWMELLPASQVYELVLAEAGARPWDREPVARRVIDDILMGRGGCADEVEGYGGWPYYQHVRRNLNVPNSPCEIESNGHSRLENWIWDQFRRPPVPGTNLDLVRAAAAAARDRAAELQRELELLASQI